MTIDQDVETLGLDGIFLSWGYENGGDGEVDFQVAFHVVAKMSTFICLVY